MCVILVCPPRVRPSRSVLKACHQANPHGAGIAWRLPGRRQVAFLKGLDLAGLREALTLPPDDEELLIHFRLASVGPVNPRLCHPFPVRRRTRLPLHGVARAVLVHNGTWPDYREALEEDTDGALTAGLPADGPLSDTLVIAALVARDGPGILEDLPGRFVHFSAQATRHYGQWETFQGLLVSNLFFTQWLPRRSAKPAPFPHATQ